MNIDEDTNAPLNIVISTEGAVVVGTVRRADGELAGQGLALLIPEGRYARIMSFRRVALINDEGRFRLRGVTPGLYRLFAFAGWSWRAIRDPDVTAPFAGQGLTVRLGAGERVETDLTLIPAPEQAAP